MPTKPSYNPVGYKFDLKIQDLLQGGDTITGGSFSIADRNDATRRFNLTERSDPAEAGIYEYVFPDRSAERWSHFFIFNNDNGQDLYDYHYQNFTVPTQLPLPFSSGGLVNESYSASAYPMSYLAAILGGNCMFLDSENADYWLTGIPGIAKIPDTLSNFFRNGTTAQSALHKDISLDTFAITDVSDEPFNLSSEAAIDSGIHKYKISLNVSEYNQNAGKIMAYTQGANHFSLLNRYIKAPIANITDHDDIPLIEENVGVFYMGKGLPNTEIAIQTESFDSIGSWVIYKTFEGTIERGQISYTDYTSGISTAYGGEEGSGTIDQ